MLMTVIVTVIGLLLNILGILIFFFIPGYLLIAVLFREMNLLERIALSIGFSISISIAVALFLGLIKFIFPRFSGITELNILVGLILFSIFFFGLLIARKIFTGKNVHNS